MRSILALAVVALCDANTKHERTVYVIRHADKIGETCDLCHAGEIRARQLTKVFSGARYHDNPHVFSKPEALFYFHMEHKYDGASHQRCYETLKYVSEKLALPRQPLHETHTREGNRHAAAKIRASPARVVLVAWEHRNIPLLAEALGYSESNPEFKHELEKCHSKLGGWPTDADFDFVYTFSYGAGSDRLVGFSCRHEGVTPFIPAGAYDNCNKHDDC